MAAIHAGARGKIVAVDGRVLAESVKDGDSYRRRYADRSLAQVIGYGSAKYGAAGIEAVYQESLIGQDPSDLIGQWRARYFRERSQPGSVLLRLHPQVPAAPVAALRRPRRAVVALHPT